MRTRNMEFPHFNMSEKEKFNNLEIDSTNYETRFTTKYLNRKTYQKKDPKIISAFIPGIIKEVYIHEGHKVKDGEKLLILEAMKMENTVFAPLTGTLKKVHVKKNERVSKGQILIELE